MGITTLPLKNLKNNFTGFSYNPLKDVFNDINNISNPINDFKKFIKDPL